MPTNLETPTPKGLSFNLEPAGKEKPGVIFDRKAAKSATGMVDSYLELFLEGPEALGTALKLHMYNFLRENPKSSSTNAQEELDSYGKLLRKELKAAKDSNLPSIGIEVEVPQAFFPYNGGGGCLWKYKIFLGRDRFTSQGGRLQEIYRV